MSQFRTMLLLESLDGRVMMDAAPKEMQGFEQRKELFRDNMTPAEKEKFDKEYEASLGKFDSLLKEWAECYVFYTDKVRILNNDIDELYPDGSIPHYVPDPRVELDHNNLPPSGEPRDIILPPPGSGFA